MKHKNIANVGITSFKVRKKIVGFSDYEALIRVQGFSKKKIKCGLTFSFQYFEGNSLSPSKSLSNIYRKNDDLVEEPIFLTFDLNPGEEKTFFLPKDMINKENQYEKEGYSFQGGFHFLDRYTKKDGQVVQKPFEGGILKATLKIFKKEKGTEEILIQDSFQADNQAFSVIPKPKRYMVYWINGSSNEFLRALLENYQEIERMEISSKEYLTIPKEGKLEFLRKGVQNKPPDVVIFDHCEPGVELPKGNYLFLNVSGKGVPLKEKKREDGTPETLSYPIEIKDIQEEHPILRYVQLKKLFLLRCRSMEMIPSEKGKVLVSTYRTPLLAVGKKDHKKWVYLGMDPRDSILVLQNAFVLLMTNSIEWLVKESLETTSKEIPLGSFFLTKKDETVKKIDGSLLKPLYPNKSIYKASSVGVYKVQQKKLNVKVQEKSYYLAMNLLQSSESHLKSITNLGIGEKKITSISLSPKKEFWSYLALLAFFILLFEWIIFTLFRFF